MNRAPTSAGGVLVKAKRDALKRAPTFAAVRLSKVAGHRRVERLLRWGFCGQGDGET
jgi:hypothetical protein